MFTSLTNINQASYLYLLKATAISIIPALFIALGFSIAITPTSTLKFDASPLQLVIILVIFVPLIETFLLVYLIKTLNKFLSNKQYIAITAAVIWAFLHGLKAIEWGFIIAWSFYVFSISFLTWQKRSTKQGFIMSLSIHALQNLFVACGLILLG
ncbi:hypothetical protein Q4489_02625 [Thalassotalea sp. 1_MG-2023]|uniref:hypothetical protein n=1 Tax=Thalassotalea sp. 1_MG-2023 TaxID=3062680 RepID=UPI0026E3DFDA|nr:hypothetical protein [Thalassotalea sp. 1_MG-2023]MDO6425885.1 hypothetical protein [Thalassotalea sp. 1_MG-2023]